MTDYKPNPTYPRTTRRRVLQAGGTAFALGTLSGHAAAQATGLTVYVGSSDNNVYALDAGDGTEQWAFETGYLVKSSPTVVENPASDDNIGSRVQLGTLGHHGDWEHADQNIEPRPEDREDGFAPGFGLSAALTGMGGAGYLLKHRLDDEIKSQ